MTHLADGRRRRRHILPMEGFSTRSISRINNNCNNVDGFTRLKLYGSRGNQASGRAAWTSSPFSTFMASTFRKRSILPGFGLALGYTIFYLCLIVLIPLAATFLKPLPLPWSQFWHIASGPRALASYRLTFGASLIGASSIYFSAYWLRGFWCATSFPAKRLFDSMVDLPFALPTAVAGIALTTIYAPNGWLGKPLAALGIKAAYTPFGVTIALTFIGLPFVVRSVQPILEDMDKELEEASASLGANPLADVSLAWCCLQFSLRRWRDSLWLLRGRWESTVRWSSSPAICR